MANKVSPEMKQQLKSLLQLSFPKNDNERYYPGLILSHGKRTMLQINVPAIDVPNLLQAKPATANNPDSGKDRPEIKGHADEIIKYIVERASHNKPWILSTLTANIAPEMITVDLLGQGFCMVIIPNGVKLDMTDGQHRLRAICELLKTAQSRFIIDEFFPITIILEDNFHQCQTDFSDIAQAKPVDQSLLVVYGDSVRAQITKNLINKVQMFRGKTDKLNKLPRKKEKLIYTANYIARALSCAFTDNPEDELESYQVEKSSEVLANCLNHFFSECDNTRHIYETSIEKLMLDQVNDFREECLLGVSVGLEILGRLLYCTYDQKSNSFNSSKVLLLAKLDWSRTNSLWHNNIVRINTKLKKPTLTISWGAGSLADAVKAAKSELGWI